MALGSSYSKMLGYLGKVGTEMSRSFVLELLLMLQADDDALALANNFYIDDHLTCTKATCNYGSIACKEQRIEQFLEIYLCLKSNKLTHVLSAGVGVST